MPTRLSSLGDAQSPRYCSNMVRIMFTSHWMGIGLTVLCLGTSGDAVVSPNPASARFRPRSAWIVCRDDRRCVARAPGIIPRAGCRGRIAANAAKPARRPSRYVPSPRGSAETVPPGEGVRPPAKGLGIRAHAPEEPRPKVAEPPKAEEPPKAVEPPRAGRPPKAKEPPKAKKSRNAKEPPKAKDPPLPAKQKTLRCLLPPSNPRLAISSGMNHMPTGNGPVARAACKESRFPTRKPHIHADSRMCFAKFSILTATAKR